MIGLSSRNQNRPSIIFFYFSGTGNTWWITNEICKKLDDYGWKTQMVSIESEMIRASNNFQEKFIELITEIDIIAFGHPIYGSDCPIPMRNFMNQIPSVIGTQNSGKRIFTYVTQMIFSGDGGFIFHKVIQSKGFNHFWSIHFNMPNNITVPKAPFSYITSQDQIEKILQKVRPQLEKTVHALKNNRSVLMGKNLMARFSGWLQRAPFQWELKNFTHKLGCNNEKCTKCELCVKYCPTNNIIMSEKGIKFLEECTLCLRCYNFCPTRAIIFGKKTNDKIIPQYQGPSIDFKLKLLSE